MLTVWYRFELCWEQSAVENNCPYEKWCNKDLKKLHSKDCHKLYSSANILFHHYILPSQDCYSQFHLYSYHVLAVYGRIRPKHDVNRDESDCNNLVLHCDGSIYWWNNWYYATGCWNTSTILANLVSVIKLKIIQYVIHVGKKWEMHAKC
jgi:hypothetical protein